MYRYIKAIAAMAISAALFLAAQLCVYANNDYLADINSETEMEATTSTTVTVDYVGNFVYENGTLTKILFEGGYVDMTGSIPKYMYYLTDHLGNVRVVADSEGNIAQVNHYYPYGDRFSDNRHALSSSSTSNNDHLFGGKELDSSSGLHDFEARYNNTRFGRFTTMDPMAEKYYGISPYSYCADNPINRMDPTGRELGDIYSIFGEFIASDGIDDNKIFVAEQSVIDDYHLKGDVGRLKDFSLEVDGAIIINRFHNDDKSTAGEFFVLGENGFNGYTMERGGSPSKESGKCLPIPEGIYTTYPRAEGEFAGGFAFRIVNNDVPRSRGILGHVGTNPSNSEGCVLFGLDFSNNQKIGNSKSAMNSFKQFYNNKNSVIMIINKLY